MKRITQLPIQKSFVVIIMSVFFVNLAVILFALNLSQTNSVEIDLSGRNRMLSQRMVLFSKLYKDGDETAREIALKACNLHDESLYALKYGGIAPEMGSGQVSPPSSKSIEKALFMVEKAWKPYRASVLKILNKDQYSAEEQEEAMHFLTSHTTSMLKINNALVQEYVMQSKGQRSTLLYSMIGYLVFLFGVCIIMLHFFNRFVFREIGMLAQGMRGIVEGDYEYRFRPGGGKELLQLSKSLNEFLEKVKKAKIYVSHLGEGNLDWENSENDELFSALERTRGLLLEERLATERRVWVNEGHALFADTLRQQSGDVGKFSRMLLKQLVDYVKAAQGALFLLEKSGDQQVLEMKSCYAYSREKFKQKVIPLGEGLISEVVMENQYHYMVDLPENYCELTTGLGGTTPRALLIVPLSSDQEVVGVLELAAMRELKDFEIDFVLKLAESIGASLLTMKMNIQNLKLLQEAEEMAEQMRAQEEELRQNMEELQATQENMIRAKNDRIGAS
ncbi:GAF domain-containing protein [Persicobacter diffluens]|uniref:HAMP domain-containing protein n=1 Tax=Persicobacter diffluens TaxID=981 RepID=A0AAN5AIQ6_9BACT|nr:hypothetical protein PEDI_12820 [Persicobacter diffluens]